MTARAVAAEVAITKSIRDWEWGNLLQTTYWYWHNENTI